MDRYTKLTRKATKLVNDLQEDITSGKRRMIENYGQKEISKFIDKELTGLNYQEACNIKDILHKVSSIN